MLPRLLVQYCIHLRSLKLWNGWRYSIEKYDVKVSLNGITSPLNSIKIYHLVQKLLWGNRQTAWWSHNPHFPI
jgi:hypothetical protein